MIADLHMHTTASDGRLSPLQLIKHATEAGLSTIAITDHDTVDGLLQVAELEEATLANLTIIPGIEFSTDLPENEVHILGYFIDIYNKELRRQLAILVTDRHNRTKQIILKLNQLGYFITYEGVLELAHSATAIGRPHIAKALVEKNYCASVSEVFTTLLDKNGPAYVPHHKLTPKQVIELIKKAGGLPILAHPGLVGNDNIVSEVIEAGIVGLEVYHPTHDEMQIEKYQRMARQHHLLITGGSDFHGIPGRFPEKLGVFTIPAALVEKLQKGSKY